MDGSSTGLSNRASEELNFQLDLACRRSTQNQTQTMRTVRKTVTFTSRLRRESCLLTKSRAGLSLLIPMQIKKYTKNAFYRRFLGELARLATNKEVEERSELEIMAKTLR